MIMKRMLITLIAVSLCGAAGFANADDASDEATDNNLDQALNIDLEDYSMTAEKSVGYGAIGSFLEWHGYLNFEYDDKEGTHSNFDNHEFYLSATGHMSERVSVTAEFEYEHAPEKLILPIQAYGNYKISDAFNIRAGLFYIPFGIPVNYTLRGNNNKMIRQVAVIHDIVYENWAEVGVEVFGDVPFNDNVSLQYDMSIGNGVDSLGTGDSWFNGDSTLTSHSEDNNDDKAIAGRVGLHFQDLMGASVSVGASFATQKYDAAELLEQKHTGVDVRIHHQSGLRFQAEWIERSGDDNVVDLVNGIAADAGGWYAQASYRRYAGEEKWWEVVAMIDEIDLNQNTETGTHFETVSFGFNFSPEANFIIKAEYDLVDEPHGASIDNNVMWASLVWEF